MNLPEDGRFSSASCSARCGAYARANPTSSNRPRVPSASPRVPSRLEERIPRLPSLPAALPTRATPCLWTRGSGRWSAGSRLCSVPTDTPRSAPPAARTSSTTWTRTYYRYLHDVLGTSHRFAPRGARDPPRRAQTLGARRASRVRVRVRRVREPGRRGGVSTPSPSAVEVLAPGLVVLRKALDLDAQAWLAAPRRSTWARAAPGTRTRLAGSTRASPGDNPGDARAASDSQGTPMAARRHLDSARVSQTCPMPLHRDASRSPPKPRVARTPHAHDEPHHHPRQLLQGGPRRSNGTGTARTRRCSAQIAPRPSSRSPSVYRANSASQATIRGCETRRLSSRATRQRATCCCSGKMSMIVHSVLRRVAADHAAGASWADAPRKTQRFTVRDIGSARVIDASAFPAYRVRYGGELADDQV